ncbi:MAG TPA: DUF1572 family protein [Terriglobales bacterium]|nr:DUF1572 family protein [Terriglobales bacterium]
MDFECGAAYLDEAGRSFRGYKRMAEEAVAQVKDEELFRLLDPEDNSIAIVMKHMSGNMRSRWTDFLTTDGEKPDRHRDSEFILDSRTTRIELLQWWESGWKQVFEAIASLKPEDLEHVITIRGKEHTVLQAINRALAHYAYHVGQIVFLAKHFRSKDWQTLSIPKGQSETYGRTAEEKHGARREK